MAAQSTDTMDPYTPPRYTIDLSLKPRDRYRAVAAAYKHQAQDLIGLYDNLLLDFGLSKGLLPTVKRLSRLLLRKLYDPTQTEEIRGVSDETGISMYLLVAFNVVLDLLMGCTSGGVRTLDNNRPFSESKMLHFRTLDWTMNPLRRVVVQLDFINSKSDTPGKVLASSITYVGFVGVLTGVRTDLSMSLNFRAVHDATTRSDNFRFYFHHLLVLLGRRPSIATILRKYLIGDLENPSKATSKPSKDHPISSHKPATLANIAKDVPPKHTTAAYLIFCDGKSAISVDKDFRTGKVRGSQNFVATTNHDVAQHDGPQTPTLIAQQAAMGVSRTMPGFEDLLEDSVERLKCIAGRWEALVKRERQKRKQNGESLTKEEVAAVTAVTREKLIDWVSAWPTTNEETHYAAIMDPTEGKISWALVHPNPPVEPS